VACTTHHSGTHHDDVDEEIESLYIQAIKYVSSFEVASRTHNDDPADRRLSQQLRVAQKGSGRVVVDVQESKRLLLED
jgi:hypothetical protein